MILEFIETEWFDLFTVVVFCAGINVVACCAYVPLLGLLARVLKSSTDHERPLSERIVGSFFLIGILELMLAALLLFNSDYNDGAFVETYANNIFGATLIVWMFAGLAILIGLLRIIFLPIQNWMFPDNQTINTSNSNQQHDAFDFDPYGHGMN